MRPLIFVVFWLCLIPSLIGNADPRNKGTPFTAQQAGFSTLFNGLKGTFVIYNERDDQLLTHNPTRAKKRFSPWSTFDIPAAIILLETNTLSSIDEKIPWDPLSYPAHPSLSSNLHEQWSADNSIRSAYHGYAVWVFQSQLKRLSPKLIADYLKKFGYGNQLVESDDFWLGKSLNISALEQITFLRNLVNQQLSVKADTQEEILPMMVTKQFIGKEINNYNTEYLLAIKTGSGVSSHRDTFGWAIGYVEKNQQRYFFAMNLEMTDYAALSTKREEIVYGVLIRLELLPKEI